LVSNKSRPQSKNERLAIATAIQHHLDAHGLARKDLIRDYLSKSTIDKLFQGEFSERTLTKIEAILKISLTSKPGEDDQAPGQFGGYTLHAVEYMQGDYLCVRPMFTHPTNLSAYIIRIVWDRTVPSLCFEELSRPDFKYAQKGAVYVPFGTPFINLVSTHLGNLRTVLLSLPDRDWRLPRAHHHAQQPEGHHVHASRGADLPPAARPGRAAGAWVHRAGAQGLCRLPESARERRHR
jgi:hypothetical protein